MIHVVNWLLQRDCFLVLRQTPYVIFYQMLFSALAQAPKLTTVFSVVRSHACNPFARRGFRNLGVYGFAFPKSMQRLRPQSTPLCQRGIHGRSALEIEELYNGNKAYIAKMSEMNPGLLQSLAHNGQSAFFFFWFNFQKQSFSIFFTQILHL